MEHEFVTTPESTVTIRFQDCDPFGHLNNARFIDYFINAREDQLIQFYDYDIYKLGKETQCNWVVAKHQIAYLAPVNYREEVRIRTSLIRFAETSLHMEGQMFRKDGLKLKSIIWTEYRYVSLGTGRPVPHSAEILDFLDKILLREEALVEPDFQERTKTLISRI